MSLSKFGVGDTVRIRKKIPMDEGTYIAGPFNIYFRWQMDKEPLEVFLIEEGTHYRSGTKGLIYLVTDSCGNQWWIDEVALKRIKK